MHDPRNDMDPGEEDATLFLVFLAIGFVSYIFALYALLIKPLVVVVVVVVGLIAVVALLDTALVIHQRGFRTGEPLGECSYYLQFRDRRARDDLVTEHMRYNPGYHKQILGQCDCRRCIRE